MSVVVDAHVHLFDEGFLPESWYESVAERWAASVHPPRDASSLDVEEGLLDGDAELLTADLESAGIDKALCLALDWGISLGEEPARSVGDVHRHYSKLQGRLEQTFYAAAGIDPRRDDAVDLLTEALDELELRALKLYPPCGFLPSDAICRPMFEVCADRNIPVIIHTSFVGYPHLGRLANPLFVGDVQRQHPDLSIVLAHAGYPFWDEEAAEVVAHHPNSYLEISNWNQLIDDEPERLVRLVAKWRDRVGAHRILFGSDHLGGPRFGGPRSRLGEWVGFIRDLPNRAKRVGRSFSDDEVELILGGNALRVFELD